MVQDDGGVMDPLNTTGFLSVVPDHVPACDQQNNTHSKITGTHLSFNLIKETS